MSPIEDIVAHRYGPGPELTTTVPATSSQAPCDIEMIFGRSRRQANPNKRLNSGCQSNWRQDNDRQTDWRLTNGRQDNWGRQTNWRKNNWLGRMAAAILLALCLTSVTAHAEDLGASRSELIRTLLPTVVNISVRKQDKPTPPPNGVMVGSKMDSVPAANDVPAAPTIKSYVGSGFIIDPSGLVATNYHVVEDAFEITVVMSDGASLPGKLVSASRLADLALVQVKADHPLAAVHWGDSDQMQIGDQVFAAGNPFGIGLSISAGIVSGLNRDIQDSPYDDLIQTDATINHGNSGGPLFDMQGNVIGVDTAIISPTTGSVGLGFAIPSNTARFVLTQLRTYGWVRPAWIGLKVQQVTPEIAEAIGMSQPTGSIVSWVLPGGPAQKAGLEIADVILRYGDHIPTDERALLRDIARTKVGDTMDLLVRHQGAEHVLKIVAAEWPRDQWDKRDAPMQATKPKVVIPPDLGLSLSVVPPAHRAAIGLENGLDGVLVTAVAPNSDPARRGMVNGDVILRVQDTPVATPAEVQTHIDQARAAKRDYVLMLILPKVRDVPGPKWVPLQLGSEGS